MTCTPAILLPCGDMIVFRVFHRPNGPGTDAAAYRRDRGGSADGALADLCMEQRVGRPGGRPERGLSGADRAADGAAATGPTISVGGVCAVFATAPIQR